MPESEKPNWQPISFLPKIAEMIDGMLEAVVENQKLLGKAEPASLDDATVSRVMSVYTTQRDDLWLYEDQLAVWRKTLLNESQTLEITRLEKQLGELRRGLEKILVMKPDLEKMTIEHLLGKSHLELGLDFLRGNK
jgi:hypothetical protein